MNYAPPLRIAEHSETIQRPNGDCHEYERGGWFIHLHDVIGATEIQLYLDRETRDRGDTGLIRLRKQYGLTYTSPWEIY